MKTFRLTSFFVLKEDQEHSNSKFVEVPLVDGLIINKEDPYKNWLIEILVNEEDLKEVEEYLSIENIKLEVTITKRENPPAAFFATLKSMNPLGNQVSILFDASIIRDKEDITDIILRDLVNEGLTGEDLLNRFARIKREKGSEYRERLANDLKKS